MAATLPAPARTARGLPPGPRAPAAAQTLQWVARPIPFMRRARAEFGDTFTVRMAHAGTFVFLSDPADIKAVFTGDARRLRAGEANVVLEPVVGSRSVLLLDGPEHLRQRKLLLPPFHGERMVRYAQLIREVTERAVAEWPVGEPFALQERTQAITLEIILRAVFGAEEPEHLAELEEAVLRLLRIAATGVALLPWLQRDLGPGSPWRGFLRDRAHADAVLFAHLERRRADPDLAERDDVLSLLLSARDEEGQPLSDVELRDELVTLLVAGHETTATGLAWAFEALFREPEAMAALREESRDGDGYAWADAVVREILRLRPPLPLVARRAAAPVEVAGHELPEGTLVAPCIYLTHRRADLYPEPDAFRPQRFLHTTPDTYAWLPFGGGIRRCIGASFALLEMREVLRTVLREVELGPAGPAESVRRRAIVLAPRHGARAVIAARAG